MNGREFLGRNGNGKSSIADPVAARIRLLVIEQRRADFRAGARCAFEVCRAVAGEKLLQEMSLDFLPESTDEG